MKKKPFTLEYSILVTVVITLFLGFQSIFFVQQSERSVVVRLGQLVSEQGQVKIYEPGIHFRAPLIDHVYSLDARQQIWIMDSDPVQTIDQLYLLVDFYFKWEIKDYAEFFRIHAAGGSRSWKEAKKNVEILLNQRIKNAVLEEFGRRPLGRLITEDRKDMMNTFGPSLTAGLKDLAVTLIDLRLKKIELPEDVSEKVYNRMRTEREKSATMLRARGLKKAEKIRAQTDYDIKMILANALAEASILKGQADAEVAQAYAEAFTPRMNFYQFLRGLEADRTVYGSSQNLLILSKEDSFLSILKERTNE